MCPGGRTLLSSGSLIRDRNAAPGKGEDSTQPFIEAFLLLLREADKPISSRAAFIRDACTTLLGFHIANEPAPLCTAPAQGLSPGSLQPQVMLAKCVASPGPLVDSSLLQVAANEVTP